MSATGLFAGYAAELEVGLADRGGPGQRRGSIASLGVPRALLFAGSARLGQQVTFSVAGDVTSQSLAVLLGFDRAAVPTTLGILHVAPNTLATALPFPAPGQLSLTVPNDAALVDLALVAQHAYSLHTSPSDPRLGNPTTTWVRR